MVTRSAIHGELQPQWAALSGAEKALWCVTRMFVKSWAMVELLRHKSDSLQQLAANHDPEGVVEFLNAAAAQKNLPYFKRRHPQGNGFFVDVLRGLSYFDCSAAGTKHAPNQMRSAPRR